MRAKATIDIEGTPTAIASSTMTGSSLLIAGVLGGRARPEGFSATWTGGVDGNSFGWVGGGGWVQRTYGKLGGRFLGYINV